MTGNGGQNTSYGSLFELIAPPYEALLNQSGEPTVAVKVLNRTLFISSDASMLTDWQLAQLATKIANDEDIDNAQLNGSVIDLEDLTDTTQSPEFNVTDSAISAGTTPGTTTQQNFSKNL